MAKKAKKKKATQSKKTTKKKVSKKEIERVMLAEQEEIREEGTLTIIFATIVSLFFAVFITLSLMDKCGPVGEFIKRIILSFFGTLGYAFPVVIVLSVIVNIVFKKNINIKIYMILTLFICILSILDNYYNEYMINEDVFESISRNIERAMNNGIIFENGLYSGGIIGGLITILLNRSVGRVGTFSILILVSILSFLIIFGSQILGVIKNIVVGIIMFIPNLIMSLFKKSDEKEEGEIDPRDVLYQTDIKDRYEKLYDKPLDPEVELLKKYDFNFNENYDNAFDRKVERSSAKNVITQNKEYKNNDTTITSSEIQSRFFNANETSEDKEKKKLLKTIKNKSINEVMSKNDGINPSSFFYNTGNEDFLANTEGKEYKDDLFDYNNLDEREEGFGRERAKESILNDKFIKKKPIDESRYESKVQNKVDSVKKETRKENTINKETRSTIRKQGNYKFPPLSYLERSQKQAGVDNEYLRNLKTTLVETLKQFDIGVEVTNITIGPKVTRFELKPAIGVRVSKILSFHDDLKLALAATDIRIEAPIPGKSVIGIEVPNKTSQSVLLGDIISSPQFRNAESKLTIAIGKDIGGEVIVADIRKMPHLLVAGATGSGKSVFINTLIMSILYKSSPEDVKLIMVDPKRVELQGYEKIPHLLIPVVTNPKKANSALNWAVGEMERRYNLLVNENVRDIESYNEQVEATGENEKMPYIVIIIDEFADLMMTSSKEVENSIMRIAQLARACGIYLVIATQRPSVKVISGSIKANIPSRISFAVSSYVDSMTIIDRKGAENLLGNGDMLYMPQGQNDPKRVQGCFVSSNDIERVVDFVSQNVDHEFNAEVETKINDDMNGLSDSSLSNSGYDENEKDDLYLEVGKFIIESNQSSIGALQRRFKLGFNRAARIIDQLERNGVVGPQEGKKAREILMTYEEFLQSNNG